MTEIDLTPLTMEEVSIIMDVSVTTVARYVSAGLLTIVSGTGHRGDPYYLDAPSVASLRARLMASPRQKTGPKPRKEI